MSIQNDFAYNGMSATNNQAIKNEKNTTDYSYDFGDEEVVNSSQSKQQGLDNQQLETRGRGDVPTSSNTKAQVNNQDFDAKSVASSSSRSKSKDLFLQNQLQKSQSKLFSLAKRIDQCLVTSKAYSDSKMQQATEVDELSVIDENEQTESKRSKVAENVGRSSHDQNKGSSENIVITNKNKQNETSNVNDFQERSSRKYESNEDQQIFYSENNNIANFRSSKEESKYKSLNPKDIDLKEDSTQSKVPNQLDLDIEKQFESISSFLAQTSKSMKEKGSLDTPEATKTQEVNDIKAVSNVEDDRNIYERELHQEQVGQRTRENNRNIKEGGSEKNNKLTQNTIHNSTRVGNNGVQKGKATQKTTEITQEADKNTLKNQAMQKVIHNSQNKTKKELLQGKALDNSDNDNSNAKLPSPEKYTRLDKNVEHEDYNLYNANVVNNKNQTRSKLQQQNKVSPVKPSEERNSKAKKQQELVKANTNKNSKSNLKHGGERLSERQSEDILENEREFNLYQPNYAQESKTRSPVRQSYDNLQEHEQNSSSYQSASPSPQKLLAKKASPVKPTYSKATSKIDTGRNVKSGSSSTEKPTVKQSKQQPVKVERKLSNKLKNSYASGANVDVEANYEKDLSFNSEEDEQDNIGDNEQSEMTYNNDMTKSRDELRSSHSRSRAVSQGVIDKSYYDDEVESSFLKAYTSKKNKIINEVPNFEERMDSDIFFRRRFKDDLKKFLNEYKPKLSAEQAEDLYERLISDVKRRQVNAHKNEVETEKRLRNQKEEQYDISEDQLNQTFDRLVADARKRMFVQEEREKIKILNEKEEDEKIKKEAKTKGMSRKAEVSLVIKMMEDAGRRKIEKMKMEKAKMEEEAIKAEELLRNRYKNKNNRTKSKVKEYIECQAEPTTANTNTYINQKAYDSSEKPNKSTPKSKNFSHSKRKSIETSLEEPLIIDDGDIDLKRHKFEKPKTRYVNIASPKGNLNMNVKHTDNSKGESGRPKSYSNVEYLKNLRSDINKYKNDIEEQIQTLQNIDQTTSSKADYVNSSSIHNQSKASNAHNASSSKGSPVKKSNKYSHIESKVAKHIENISANQASPEDLSTAQDINYSASKRKYYKQYNTPVKVNGNESVQTESSEKKREKYNPAFMCDQEAMVFVNKLINKFKVENKL